MTIAIQAADLDATRIDGTRVYLLELLKRFGTLAPNQTFHLYHKQTWNEELTPPHFDNYTETALPFPSQWMQTRFALEMFRTKPQHIFFPVQAVPVFLPPTSKITVAIHDLAWKHYPETFTTKTRFKLNFLLKHAIQRADTLITVSESTKRDLLFFFPEINLDTIRVIHHGFDRTRFVPQISQEEKKGTLVHYGLHEKNYFLYVGALQPRKNLIRLIKAFDLFKSNAPEAKLVLVGETAWLSEPILAARDTSPYRDDIVLTGKVSFTDLPAFYQGSRAFVFPSLYEGFGMPILEAFASETPVLTANNSSLPEVAGDAALYCTATDTTSIAEGLTRLWNDTALRTDLIQKGYQRLTHFSWDTCAKQTLESILQ